MQHGIELHRRFYSEDPHGNRLEFLRARGRGLTRPRVPAAARLVCIGALPGRVGC